MFICMARPGGDWIIRSASRANSSVPSPLPLASVEFFPESSQFGAELNSTGVTDEKGRFKLTCHYNGELGAAVGRHRVVVTEGPPPAGARGMDGASQQRLADHMAKLGNRTIPDRFGNYSQTPIRIEVIVERKEYVIDMK